MKKKMKGKTLLIVVNTLFVFRSVLKQNIIFSVFSVTYWMGAKIQISSNSCRVKGLPLNSKESKLN